MSDHRPLAHLTDAEVSFISGRNRWNANLHNGLTDIPRTAYENSWKNYGLNGVQSSNA